MAISSVRHWAARVAGAALVIAITAVITTAVAAAASDPRYSIVGELHAIRSSSSGGNYQLQARLARPPRGPIMQESSSFSMLAKMASSPLGCAGDLIFRDGFEFQLRDDL